VRFRVVRENTAPGAHSPIFVIEAETGQGVGWINRYLDREYVRRLADKSLYGYAHSLLQHWRRRRRVRQRRPRKLRRSQPSLQLSTAQSAARKRKSSTLPKPCPKISSIFPRRA